jgi:hypothetical protein
MELYVRSHAQKPYSTIHKSQRYLALVTKSHDASQLIYWIGIPDVMMLRGVGLEQTAGALPFSLRS